MKQFKFIVITIFLLIITKSVFSQISPVPTPIPSPTASSLGQYGKIPVSEYTGVPNISIPLYTIKYRDMTLPISLDYHASGIKVQQEASWVGLGWALNAGGVITRKINGHDDLGYEEIKSLMYKGFPFDSKPSNMNSWGEYFFNAFDGDFDTEPDEFTYNVAGLSGTFYLKPIRGNSTNYDYLETINVKPDNSIIRYNHPSRSWEITSADGTIYYFKTKERTQISSGSSQTSFNNAMFQFSYDDRNNSITSWYLDKIKSPNENLITFEYYKTTNENPAYSSMSFLFKSNIYTTKVDPGCSIADPFFLSPITYNISRNYNDEIYLKKISWGNDFITFSINDRDDLQEISNTRGSDESIWISAPLNTKPQKLYKISINSNNKEKGYIFNTSYFNNNATGSTAYLYKRLKLDGITEYGVTVNNTQDTKEPYKFYYNETKPLPSKESFAQDFWGYYNGVNDNDGIEKSLVPYGRYYYNNEVFQVGNANRFPNENYLKSGVLTKIEYPTKGYTIFEYEPHDYHSTNPQAWLYTDYKKVDPVALSLVRYSIDKESITNNSFYDEFTLTEPTAVTFQINNYYNDDHGNIDHSSSGDIWGFYARVKDSNSPPEFTNNSSIPVKNFADYYNIFNLGYQGRSKIIDYNPRTGVYTREYTKIFTEKLPAGTYRIGIQDKYLGYFLSIVVSYQAKPIFQMEKDNNNVWKYNASGLRIAKITDYDNNGNSSIKKYVYNEFNDADNRVESTGKLQSIPIYHTPCRLDGLACTILKFDGYSWNNVPANSSSVVCYDKVTILDGENGENGKTVKMFINNAQNLLSGTILNPASTDDRIHDYSSKDSKIEEKLINSLLSWLPHSEYFTNANIIEGGLGEYPSPIEILPGVATESFIENGNIDNISIYNSKNKLIKNIDYYNVFLKDKLGLSYLKILSFPTPTMPGFDQYKNVWPYSLSLWSGVVKPISKTETDYFDDGSQIIHETNYTYNSIFQLASEITNIKNSLSTQGKLYKYPIDYNIPSFTIDIMQQKNMLNYVIEEQELKNNKIISGVYNEFVGTTIKDPVLLKNVYQIESNTPIVPSTLVGVGNDGLLKTNTQYKKKMTYDYDNNGNIIQTQKTNDIPTTYLWGYNSTLPIAKIENAYSSDVALLYNATDIQTKTGFDLWNALENIRTKSILSRAMMIHYTYEPLYGITMATDPNGIRTFYDYDALGRLKCIRNADKKILKTYDYNYAK